ncbi:MAG: hypothetical protein LBF91_01575 [Azoarcus sp.]|jgi:cysteine synthase|nr:hypothetical protein [Azoarcus sp.]
MNKITANMILRYLEKTLCLLVVSIGNSLHGVGITPYALQRYPIFTVKLVDGKKSPSNAESP